MKYVNDSQLKESSSKTHLKETCILVSNSHGHRMNNLILKTFSRHTA